MRSKSSLIHYPRLSITGLMVLIAIFGLVLGGARWINVMWPEQMERRLKALEHDLEVERWKELTTRVDEPEVALQIIPKHFHHGPPRFFQLRIYRRGESPASEASGEVVRRPRDEILALCREFVEFHERMRRKWSRAAWCLWQPVEPDEMKPLFDGRVEVSPWIGMY